jgi:hypothetical protein
VADESITVKNKFNMNLNGSATTSILSAICHPPSAISHQRSAIGHRLIFNSFLRAAKKYEICRLKF